MRVIVEDLWAVQKPTRYFICVPVNWTYSKTTGKAVMGRGVAHQAAELYPELADQLGETIQEHPRTPHISMYKDLLLLPVKYHWKHDADVALICDTLRRLVNLQQNLTKDDDVDVLHFYLPLLGAGFGGLDPLMSMTLMATILTDDSFIVVLKNSSVQARYRSSFRPSKETGKTDRTLYKGMI